MILETLKSANSVILDSVQVASNKQAAKVFKTQVIALSGLTPKLEQLLNIITAMKDKGIASNVVSQDVKNALQTAVDNCGMKASEHTLDAGTVSALKNAIDLCNANIESCWKAETNEKISAVIDSLTSLRSLLKDKKEADEILEALETAKVMLPSSIKGLDAYLNRMDQGKAIIDALHLNPETESFVQKVRTQKATLNDLTPHILEWLKENNLMNQMKVRF